MSFQECVDELISAPVLSTDKYRTMQNILAQQLSGDLVSYMRSKDNGTNISVRDMKLSVIKAERTDNKAIYSHIDYGKLHSYIQFYNVSNNKVVRLTLFPSKKQAFIIGYYNNYKYNKKNNTFCKDTIMINEFYAGLGILSTAEFIGQTANFLMGISDEPLTGDTNVITNQLH